MLIWRRGSWRIESDGYLSSRELLELDDWRERERLREDEHARYTAQLAARARALRRRAWQRGYEAGKAKALAEFVGPSAAAAFGARCVQSRLVQIAMQALTEVVGELPAASLLPNQIRRCIEASGGQRLVSVRVPVAEVEAARATLARVERELGVACVAVLADAGLPPRSCVVETERGVVDGSLRLQLAALERGIRDAVNAVLHECAFIDGGLSQQLVVIEQGLRDTLDALGREPVDDFTVLTWGSD